MRSNARSFAKNLQYFNLPLKFICGCLFLVLLTSSSSDPLKENNNLLSFVNESEEEMMNCPTNVLVRYDMDACYSLSSNGSHMDYSEFTPAYPNDGGCSSTSATGVYRDEGPHSCIVGQGGSTAAACFGVGGLTSFENNSPKAIRFEVTINPNEDGEITGLRFHERGPNSFNHLSGSSGTNNHPTKYGVRITKNGTEIFKQIDIATTEGWTLETFDFSNNPAFLVSTTTTFKFELLSYDAVGNNGNISAWDLDNIEISGGCCSIVTCENVTDGGQIGSDQLGCGNSFDPAPITNINSPSGGSGDLEYLWLQSTEGCPSTEGIQDYAIDGANGPTYNPGPITQTTYYLRCSRRAGCSNWDGESNCIVMEVNPNPAVSLNITSTNQYNGSDVSCAGAADATIQASGNSGTSPYTYAWSNGQSGASITGIGSGSYTVTLTDSKGCTAEESITVMDPAPVSVDLNITSNYNGTPISCAGQSDASVQANAGGGTGNYTFAWSNGQNGQNISGLFAGNYSVTVTDQNGCTATENITIEEPEAVGNATATVISNYTGEDISCTGEDDGRAQAEMTGGVTPYSYLWSNGQTSAIADGLAAGTYSVTISDANGCSTEALVTLEDPTQLSIEIAINSDYNGTVISCNGANDGSAIVTPAGGTGAYTYQWDDSQFQTSAQANNLPAGTYTVIVSDANGCTQTASITLEEPDLVEISATVITDYNGSQISCTGEDDGSAQATSIGGVLPYTFEWSNGQTGPTAANLEAGTYTVTVTDANGCSDITNVTLIDPAQISVEIAITSNYNGTAISCTGQSDATAIANAAGGTGAYSYQWDDAQFQTVEEATNLPAGTYNVLVSDANGCTATAVVTIEEPDPVSVSAEVISNYTGYDVSCTGAEDGIVQATGVGGVLPYSFEWSTGQTAQAPEGLGAGTYTVTMTDANGCSTITNVTVTDPPQLSIEVSITSDYNGAVISCFGESDGSAIVVPAGGTANYTYQWDDPQFQTSAEATGLAAGTYTVLVSDENGCTQTASITLEQPDLVVISASVISGYNGSQISCTGLSDGIGQASSIGGVLPYTFEWSNGQNGPTAEGLEAGTYTVTVTDANGCADQTTITLTDPPQLSIDVAITSDYNGAAISCSGASDGSVAVTATGGTGTYSYQWDDALFQTTAEAANVPAGTYTVLVSDQNGCTQTTTITIEDPDPMGIIAEVISDYNGSDVSCTGASDGRAQATAEGGTLPYSFTWSDGQTSQTANDIAAGTYTVTVSDANGCTAVTNVTLVDPAPISVEATISSNYNGAAITCNGASDGSLLATAAGGTGAYSYQWDDSQFQTGAEATNIAAGTYTVLVSDENGCTATATITIEDPEPVAITADVISDYNGSQISCTGAADGIAQATVTGGTLPYSFEWSNGQTSQDANGLAAGTYSVTITDANGCADQTTITLTDPPQLSIDVAITSDYNGAAISCSGASDGSVAVTATGGTGNYTYQWDDAQFQTTAEAGNVPAGTYTVLVSDANGCTQTTSITIEEPDPVVITADVISDYNGSQISCTGAADGIAQATVTGGSLPYSFEWNNGDTNQTAEGLAAGTYTVTITDINGCTAVTNITLVDPAPVSVAITISSDYNGAAITCNGANDGKLLATAAGGTGTYSYQWDDAQFQTAQEASNLSAGTYTVQVSDENGCTATATLTIEDPDPVAITADVISSYNGSDVSCTGASDGIAQATVTGGTLPYTFQWNNGQTTQTANSLSAGTFNVTITDANGCTSETTVTLVDPPQLSIDVAITSDYNGAAISCSGANDGSVAVTGTGGTGAYTYQWDDPQFQTTAEATNLSAGTYTVLVSDANGCTQTTSITIEDPDPVAIVADVISDYNGSQISCAGAADGIAQATAQGGSLPYTFEWSNGDTNQTAEGLAAGTYTVVITDANGCTAEAIVTLAAPSPVSVAVAISSNYNGAAISCNGASDGSIAATPAGGTGAYTYQWDDAQFQTGAEASNLSAGTYTVLVSDANGCTATASITIEDPDPVAITADVISNYNGSQISCAGAADGIAQATVTGGSLPYSFEWSNGDTNQTAEGLAAGTYTVTITDANGCVSSTDVTLTEPASITCEAFVFSSYNEGVDISTLGGNDGAASVNANGGTGDFTFQWNDAQFQTAQVADNLSAGTYTVLVSDANGCTCSSEITLEDPAKLGNFVFDDANANGIQDGGESGLAFVTIILTGTTEDGVEVTRETTTGADGSYSFDGLAPGTYKITVVGPEGFEVTNQNEGNDEALDSDVDPNTNMSDVVTLDNGDDYQDLDVGFYGKAEIGDFVWDDLNGNGVQDFGEPGLENVTVTLTGITGNGTDVTLTLQTGPNGEFLFTDLQPGNYKLTFNAPGGYSTTYSNLGVSDENDNDADSNNGNMTVFETLTSGESNLTYDAGFYKPVKLGDYVWLDDNGDGLQDDDENGIADVLVTLTGVDGAGIAVNQTKTTDNNGAYIFDDLRPGEYKVTFAAPTGFTLTNPEVGNNVSMDSNADTQTGMSKPVTLNSGDEDLTIDAGLFEYGSIGNYTWIDCNNNGIQDAGEEPLGSVPVAINGVAGSGEPYTASTFSNGNGFYTFENLAPGKYVISFGFPGSPNGLGYTTADATSDDNDSDAGTDGNTDEIKITSGLMLDNVDAGYLDILAPVIVSLPENVSVECDGQDNTTALNNWLATNGNAIAQDNISDASEITWTNDFNGIEEGCGATGSVTVIFTATDACGNSITTGGSFTIIDSTLPTLDAPAADLSVSCDGSGNNDAFNNWLNNNGGAQASDNCSEIIWSNSYNGSVAPDCGEITVVFTASDECGNIVQTNATFSVNDNEGPELLNIPEDVTISCNDELPSMANVTATDLCDTNVEVIPSTSSTQNSDASSCNYYNYTIIRTWTATDDCGNESVASQTITVSDNEAPDFTQEGQDLEIECNGNGNATQFLAWLNSYAGAQATDNCSSITWSNDYNGALISSCDENITVTFTATDVCGNEASTTATFKLNDTVDPTLLNVPEDVTVSCNGVPTSPTVTATDLCDTDVDVYMSEVTTQGLNPVFCSFYNYEIVRTWTAIDDCGNEATQTQTITITDDAAPEITTAASDLDSECDGVGNSNAFFAWLDTNAGATAIDDCSTITWSNDYDGTPITGCDDNITVTFTAADACDNTVTTVATFTVGDTEEPTLIGLPENVTINCDEDLPAAPNVTASDVCDTDVEVLLSTNDTQSGDPSDCAYYNYEVIRTWTAIDDCGNEVEATQTITVTDTGAPEITQAANDLQVSCTGGGNDTALNAWLADNAGATAQDGCSAVTWSNDYNGNLLIDCGTTGTITVNFIATDACGNEASTEATFTISDEEPPTLLGVPDNVSIDCSENVPAEPQVTATDDCDTNVEVEVSISTTQGSNPANCDYYNYEIIRTWIATDDCGNQTEASQTITVTDNDGPELLAEATDVTLDCSGNASTALDNWVASNGGAAAQDNCGNVTWTNDYLGLLFDCANAGSVTVTFTAADACGNEVSTTATFIITDDGEPTLLNVPGDVTVNCENVPASPTVTATDACDTDVEVYMSEVTTQGINPSDCTFYNYEIVRTWTAIDDCGNEATETQTIIVEDEGAPTLGQEATDVTVSCAGSDNFTAISNWVNSNGGATATDDCSNVLWTNDYTGFNPDCGDAGSVTVTFTAADICGNETTTTATFTISDEDGPLLIGLPDNVTVNCGDIPAMATVTATDLCDTDVQVTASENNTQSGNPSDCGYYNYEIIRTWTAIDDCGNESSQTQTITVTDTEGPEITTAPESVEVECDGSGNNSDLTTWLSNNGGAIASDNCSTVSWSNDFGSVSTNCGDAGSATVTFIATDVCGNETSVTATFNIIDNTPPQILGVPENMTVQCGEEPALPNVIATDLCDTDVTPLLSTNIISNGCFDSYLLIRTWTAVDDCGNEATATQEVTIEDTTPPTLLGVPADTEVSCGEIPEIPAINADITATDNCDVNVAISFSENVIEGDCENSYTLVRTWTAIDNCGNETVGTQNVTVGDDSPPAFTFVPENIDAACGDNSEFAPAEAEDDCDEVTITFDDDIELGDCADAYTLTRTWTATDGCGNAVSVSRTLTVGDNEAPTLINIPDDLTVNLDNGETVPEMPTNISATDDCDTNVEITANENQVTGSDCGYTLIRTWTATDDCGNETSATQEIVVISTLNVSIDPQGASICAGEQLQLSVSPTGALYTYQWTVSAGNLSSDNIADPVYTMMQAGTYTIEVSVEDENGCVGTASTTVTVGDIGAGSADSNSPICEGETLQLNATGGSSYSWSGPDGFTSNEQNPTITNALDIYTGTYTVTITDGGCSTTASVDVLVADELNGDYTATNVLCGELGTIIVGVSGGSGDYTYDWADLPGNDNTQNRDDLEAGTYSVTVTDVTGCDFVINNIEIIEDECECDAKAGQLDPDQQDLCLDNGSATISATPSGSPVIPTGYEVIYVLTSSEGLVIEAVNNTPEFQINGTGIYTIHTLVYNPNTLDLGIVEFGQTTGFDVNSLLIQGGGSICASLLVEGARFEIETLDVEVTLNIADECNNGTGIVVLSPSFFTYNWSDNGSGASRDDLAAGTYQVTATADNDCSEVINVTVGSECECDIVLNNIVVIEANCNEASGSATVQVAGNPANYTYQWDPSSGNVNAIGNMRSNLFAGIYNVTITNESIDGCSIVETFVIGNVDGPEVTDVNTTPATCNDSNGTASFEPSDYDYLWVHDNVENNSRTDLAAGQYIVVAIDPNDPNCPDIFTIEVGQTNDLSAEENVITRPACGEDDGVVEIEINNSNSNDYLFTWSDGFVSDNATRTGMSSGIYTVDVVDNDTGCEATLTFVLTDDVTGGEVLLDPLVSANCAGDENVTVSYQLILAQGFVGPAQDQIIDMDGVEVDNGNLEAGNYCVVVYDNNGCLATTNCFEVIEPQAILVDVAISNETCTDGGSISLIVSGGNDNYTYNWSDLSGDDNTQNRDNLDAGTYNVTVTDSEGCVALAETLTVGNDCVECVTPIISNVVTLETPCGEEAGTAVIEVLGNAGNYDFTWSPNLGTPITGFDNARIDLPAGTYTVIIEDSNDSDCSIETIFTIGTVGGPEATIVNTQAAICSVPSGLAVLQPDTYTYTWSDGNTGAVRTDLFAGTYQVTVSDNGADCEDYLTVVVEQENNLVGEAIINTLPNCGESNGSVTLSVTGGSGDYNYSSGSASMDDLSSGVYSVMVMDNNTGCTTMITFALTDDVAGATLTLSTSELMLSCIGDANGTVDVAVEYDAGFAFPETIEYIDANGNVVDNGSLGEGTYCVIVRDDNGCIAGQSCFEVIEPTNMVVNIEVEPQDCNELGSITLDVTGGNGEYTFDWVDLDGSNNPQNRTDLTAGNYVVTVTDGEGCQAFSQALNLTNIGTNCDDCEAPVVNNIVVIESMCDVNVGSATIVVAGDPAAYNYNWDPDVSNNNSANNLFAGVYVVTITDGNDPTCSTVESFVVGVSNGPEVTITDIQDANCLATDGGVTLSPDTYTYAWADLMETNSRNDLQSGSYFVTVTDPVTDCQDFILIEIGELNDLEATAQINSLPNCGENNGSVTINVAGGSGNYTYDWGDSATEDDLVSGTYTVSIVDTQSGCGTSLTFTLVDDVPQATITINEPNNTVELSCAGDNNGTVDFDVDFNGDYTTEILNANGDAVTNGELSAGTYCIILSNTDACLAGQECFEVVDPNAINVEVSITNQGCDEFGSITLVVDGGNGNYTFDWDDLNGADDVQNRTELNAGTYHVTITDQEGCQAVASNITIMNDCDCGADAGILTTTDPTINCVDDGQDDVMNFEVVGDTNTDYLYIVTDENGVIIGFNETPQFNFEGAGAGTCLVWGIGFIGDLENVAVGNNASEILGCFELTNSIAVIRLTGEDCNQDCLVSGGQLLTEDETTLCVDDGQEDIVSVIATGVTGDLIYVVTDEDLNILGVSINPEFNFEGVPAGTCLIWAVAFDGNVAGLEVGLNAADLDGCFDLSNSIPVIRQTGDECGDPTCTASVGTLTTDDPTTVCVSDGTTDIINVTATDVVGDITYLITDQDGIILVTSDNPQFDFEQAGPGVCLVWALAFEGTIDGLELGENAADLSGCFDLSNPVTVTRLEGDDCPCPTPSTVTLTLPTLAVDSFCVEIEDCFDPALSTFALGDGSQMGSSDFGSFELNDEGCLVYTAGTIEGESVDTILVITTFDGVMDTTTIIISILEECNGFIMSDSVEVSTFDCLDGGEFCLDIPLIEIVNYTIEDNGMPYTGGFMGCNYDTVLSYQMQPFLNVAPFGPYTLESWSVNTDTISIDTFETILDMVNLMNFYDPTGNWVINGGAIVGGTPGSQYGSIEIRQLQLQIEGSIDVNTIEIPFGTQLSLEIGTHLLVLSEIQTGCVDSVLVGVNCLECPPLYTGPTTISPPDCDAEAELCIGIDLADFSNFVITDNGLPYTGDIFGCDFDSILLYSAAAYANPGVYGLESWIVNTDTFSLDTFTTVQELVDAMNIFDPTGDWTATTGILIEGGDFANTYGDIIVSQFGNVIATSNPNLQLIPEATAMSLDTGFHQLIIVDPFGVCSDTLDITVSCELIVSPDTMLNVFEGMVDTFCIETIGLGPIDTIFNICPEGSNGNVSSTLLPIPGETCFEYTGILLGSDTFCIVVCDVLGVCDTTNLVVNVLPVTDTIPIMIPVNMVDTICIDTSMFQGNLISVTNDCPELSGVFADVEIIDGTNCVEIFGLTSGVDTACIVLCDDLGFCDTTILVLDVGGAVIDTVEFTIGLFDEDVYCVDTTELAGNIVSIENVCPELSGEYVDFTIDENTLCVDYEGFLFGSDTACIVICDDLGVCDTTILIVNVEEDGMTPPDAINDDTLTYIDMGVIIDVTGNDLVNGDSATIILITPPANGSVTQIDDLIFEYTPDVGFCNALDSFTYALLTTSGIDTATVYIFVYCDQLTVYNGFSPNGDGTNDNLFILGIENFPSNEVCIFNRWGNRVFLTKGYNNTDNFFNGTWDGKDLPDGTYFYQIDYMNEGTPVKMTGYIQIHR